MKPLNVLVMTPAFDRAMPQADEATLRRITLAGPGINVTDASTLVHDELRGDMSGRAKLDALLAETEVIFGLILPPDITARAPKLKWVQMMSAGVDRLTQSDIWQSAVTITGVSGITAATIGEFVLGFMLMFVKRVPRWFEQKQKHRWQRFPTTVLYGKTAGIVGLGSIGQEVARLCQAFGMRVVATRRSTRREGRGRHVDRLLPADRLPELLAESDFVVICVPLTGETRRLIGEKELRAMKPTAYLINIARGGIVDEEALVRALEEKWIAGAGLDVTTQEPLPPESRLWDLDNVILSPHIAGGMEDYMARAADVFCENIRRYQAGRRLRNIISRKRGY